MRLHGHMGVEMVQSAVRFFTAIPATFVHALNLFVPAPGTLVLLCARDWDE